MDIKRSKSAAAIAHEIEGEILDGTIAIGEPLRSARQEAEARGVDRKTVAAAYQVLRQRGLVEARIPGGTFVIDWRRSPAGLDWNRWWRRLHPDPSEAPAEFRGFMIDPEDEFSPNAHLRRLSSLSDRSVLILLGEAGAGKTFESLRLSDASAGAESARSVRIDLGQCDGPDAVERVISGHPDVQQWLASESRQLCLILDSFDEASGVVQALPEALVSVLGKLPRDRLTLRVFCRGNSWPERLGTQLQELWPSDDIEMWELAPLTEPDIERAAQTEGLDTVSFLGQVRALGLEELAKRPITLFMLIHAAKRAALEGTSVARLYEDGLLQLLETPASPRYERGTAESRDPQQLLEWARGVAAMSVLCGSPLVSRSILPTPGTGTLTLGTCLSHMPLPEDKYPGRSDLEELLFKSALFCAAGRDRVQFAHRSYAEFLTAQWLDRSGLDERQILSLVTVGQGSTCRVAPQLHAVVAWLAGMRQELFTLLLDLDPDALLRGDLESFTDEQRAALVSYLLAAVRNDRVSHTRLRSVQHAFKRLRHSTITSQLGAIVADDSQSESVRDIAIDMAEATCLEELGNELASIMLDPKQPMRLRISAGYALRDVRSESVRHRLIPMALGKTEGDRELTLRGCALHCVWPGLISAEELFTALEPESAPNLYASYSSFLEQFPQTLHASDLPLALAWVGRVSNGSEAHGAVERACLKILRRSWEHLDAEPGLAAAMTPIVESRLEHHHMFLPASDTDSWRARVDERAAVQREVEQHPARRRALASALVARATGEQHVNDVVRLLYHDTPLVLKEDLQWVIEHAVDENIEKRSNWIELANRLVLHHRADSWSDQEIRWIIAARNTAKGTDLFKFIDPVNIGSAVASELRKHHARIKSLGRPQRRTKSRGSKQRSLRDQAEHLLTHSPSAPVWSWSWLTHLLRFGKSWDELELGGGAFVKRLSKVDLWTTADRRMQHTVLEAAQRALESCSPLVGPLYPQSESDQWHSQLWLALQLVADEDPNWLKQRSAAWWSVWARFIAVGAPDWLEQVTPEDCVLGHCALTQDRQQVLACIVGLLRAAQGADQEVPTLMRFERCRDPELHQVVADALSSSPSLGPKAFRGAITFLMKAAPSMARQQLQRWLSDQVISSPETREQSVTAAQLAIRHLDDAGWADVGPAMVRHGGWAIEVLHGFVDRRTRDEQPFWSKLRPEECGELVYFMSTDLPIGILPDRMGTGAYSPTKAEEVDRLRQAATVALVRHHPSVAAQAMLRLRRARPDNLWFADLFAEAIDGTNAGQWQPIDPKVLKRLAHDRKSRYVETEEQLLDIVIESIRSFAMQLHDKFNPLVGNLWNIHPEHSHAGSDGSSRVEAKPPVFKGEDHLTDNLVVHLRRELGGRGVVANREVRISPTRRTADEVAGKRLDILVEAVNLKKPDQPPLRVIVEVKVDRNREWRTGLGKQLVERYLNRHECRTGLYVVAWTGDVKSRQTIDTHLARATSEVRADDPLLTVRTEVMDCRFKRSP